MSAALMILPLVWAAVEASPKAVAAKPVESAERRRVAERRQHAAPELAFYRKYTEGLLRRYVRLSLEAGRAPSLLGKDMFRGKVTNYRVHGFDDVVIFVHDVEQCLAALSEEQRTLIERIALQEYTHDETASLMKLPQRTASRRYGAALDQLTQFFLDRKLLVLVTCQVGENEKSLVNH